MAGFEPWTADEIPVRAGSGAITVRLSREGWRRAHAALDSVLGTDRERLALHEALELLAARCLPAGHIPVSRDDLVSVLAESEGFIGGKDNPAFSRLAAVAGVA